MSKIQENGVQEDAKPLASLSLIPYKHFKNCQKGKLLVLDLDRTLCDFGPEELFEMSYESRTNPNILRPYLHRFLKAVHEYYDIALWSATTLEVIKLKMETLDILDNENFKINFVLDKTNMAFIESKSLGIIGWSKPLKTIWKKYPNYNETNTIIVDDQPYNFHFNRKNGLLISQYLQDMHDMDNELTHVAPYLIKLAKNSVNFADVDHSNYKKNKSCPQFECE